MSKFPVELTDEEGIVDAVNYLLSGPQLPGRATEGFTTDTGAYITGNLREPWTTGGAVSLYRIENIATTTWLDENTIRFDYPAALPSPAFALGNNLTVNGVTPSGYDGFYAGDGVVESTTTYVVIRTRTPQPNYGAGTGGTLTFDAADPNFFPTLISTDCNAKITVDYANSQVNLNAQLKNKIQYSALNNTQGIYRVEINRYKGFASSDPLRSGFFFNYDANIARREYVLDLADTFENVTALDIAAVPPAPYVNTRAAPSLAYPETYTVINVNNITGIGQGLRVRVKIAADFPGGPPWAPGWPFAAAAYTAANTTIEIFEQGEGYQIGDFVLIDGADIGGTTGVDDLVLEITAIGGGITPTFLEYETVFSGVDDPDPPIGYYWYILDIYFERISGGTLYILGCELGERSLTAQLIKQ